MFAEEYTMAFKLSDRSGLSLPSQGRGSQSQQGTEGNKQTDVIVPS